MTNDEINAFTALKDQVRCVKDLNLGFYHACSGWQITVERLEERLKARDSQIERMEKEIDDLKLERDRLLFRICEESK